MTTIEIKELILKILGSIEPVAETHTDTKHLKNLDQWEEVITIITGELLDCANSNGLTVYYSANEIITRSRDILKEIYSWIGDYIEGWDSGNEGRTD